MYYRSGGAAMWVLVVLALGIGLYISFGIMGVHRFRGKIDEALGKKPVTDPKGNEGVLGMQQEYLRQQDAEREKAMKTVADLQAQADQMARDARRAAADTGAGEPGERRQTPIAIEMPVIPQDPQQAQQMAMDLAAQAQDRANAKRMEVEARIREMESDSPPMPPPPVPPKLPPENKPDNELSSDEAKVKKQIEDQLKAALPTHRITFDQNATMTGWIVSETPEAVTFKEAVSGAGSMSLQIKRARIKELLPLSTSAPAVTYMDIRFKMEYPDFTLLKNSPYTMVTSGGAPEAESVMKILRQLHAEFLECFKSVVPPGAAAKQSIQVLVLRDESMFDVIRRQPGGWNRSSGTVFYLENEDRLIVLDPATAAQRRRYSGADLSFEGAVRHEGVVQLCLTMGILPRGFNSRWIVEGLGAYCETEHVGQRDTARTEALKQRLKNSPTFANFSRRYADSDFCRIMIYFMMQPATKNQFMAYLKTLSRTPVGGRSDQAGEISRASGLSADEIEKRWQEYVSSF